MEADVRGSRNASTPLAALVSEGSFRAMGCAAHVLVHGPESPPLVRRASQRIAELESRWSRFQTTSEVGRLNAAAGSGAPTQLSPETITLIELAALGWHATERTWTPLMGRQLCRLGYDQPFDEVGVSANAGIDEPAVAFDQVVDSLLGDRPALPPDTALDFGGIAKGLTADLVTAELLRAGAWGAMVNLGGDLRVRGQAPDGLDWPLSISEPALGLDSLAMIRLPAGGLCTSTTARRRWAGPAADRHHLLDPRDGQPARSDVALTSVIAGDAWWAEVAATALTVDPSLALPSIAALQIGVDGSVRRLGDFERYES